MPAYITLGANDPVIAHAFYDAVLKTIGWAAHADFPGGWKCYSEAGTGIGFKFWVCPPFNGEAASAGNGQMLGLPAHNRDEVDAFYATAMALGATDEGAPGIREIYSPTWYAAYLRDPSGNKLAVVFEG
ncbi:MAG: lactoylglutathione lyase [Cypionkella sp.]|uniref:VOC family protein n=1 Tax=Cypionkella sp. TaxID=2811411 RepID=UPI002603BDDC|nr:VOC family protein [Cypionkella sp.]MDB5660206.1 lactoylglutathione lyase [Cypionkella sp.]MDB5663682.1 lactoylglutathione lyase [Cypionkella sp.]